MISKRKTQMVTSEEFLIIPHNEEFLKLQRQNSEFGAVG